MIRQLQGGGQSGRPAPDDENVCREALRHVGVIFGRFKREISIPIWCASISGYTWAEYARFKGMDICRLRSDRSSVG
jgi:hypothetical protein